MVITFICFPFRFPIVSVSNFLSWIVFLLFCCWEVPRASGEVTLPLCVLGGVGVQPHYLAQAISHTQQAYHIGPFGDCAG